MWTDFCVRPDETEEQQLLEGFEEFGEERPMGLGLEPEAAALILGYVWGFASCLFLMRWKGII